MPIESSTPDPGDDLPDRAWEALVAALDRGWSHADIGDACGLPNNVDQWLRTERVAAPSEPRVRILEGLARNNPTDADEVTA